MAIFRRALVSEYLPHGSLEELFDMLDTWHDRLLVASDVADALQYLHTMVTDDEGRPLPILHRDVKPANVSCGRFYSFPSPMPSASSLNPIRPLAFYKPRIRCS